MKKLFLLLVTVLTVTLCASAQTRTVTGTVLEEGSEEPIIGASVTAGNATMGVSTDLDGKFAIQVPANVSTIKVSHVGMQTKTVKITGSPLKIYLSSTAENLNTVIVTAYGTTTKGAYTGSAGVVNAAQLENVQVSNVTNALSGKIAGVQTFSSNGQPGTGSTVRIRGVGSINASTSPLYVVDGMPFDGGDISAIPTQDIESMTVLKDAASTALYGSRGANGVILITTKSGREGQAKVTFDMKWGVNSRALPNFDVIEDPRQYVETLYTGLTNTAKYYLGAAKAPDPHAYANQNIWSSIGYQTWTVPEGQDVVGRNGKFNPNATPGYVDGNYYFLGDDWAKETFIHGLRQEYNMNVTGGTERLKYYVSGSYLGDEGIIKNSHYNRFSTRASVDYQAKSWLKIGTSISYTYQNSAYPDDQTASGSTGNAFGLANQMSPMYPFYIRLADTKRIAYNSTYGKPIYDYGDNFDYGWGKTGYVRNTMNQANAVGSLNYDTTDILADVLDAKWYAILTPFKGFSLTGKAGYYLDNTRDHVIQNGVYGQFVDAGGFVNQGQSRTRNINLQLLAQYDFTVAQHNNFGLMVGFENTSLRAESLLGTGANLYNPSWPFLDNTIDTPHVYGNEVSLVHRGFFGRLRYDFDGKYYATASVRRDGSSRFAKNHRWGTFWSASAGWDMSKESFLQPYSDIIDILKLKFSYGQNGNDGIGANYIAYADQYQITGGDGVWSDGTLYYKGNKDITWEKSDAINTGVDFSFKKGLVSGSIEYYQRTVSDMLFNLPVAPSLGYSSVPYNVGKMRNNGFEIDLSVRPIATKDITLDINANLTMGWNKILELDPSIMNKYSDWRQEGDQGWLTGSYLRKEGKSMYNLYLVKWAGLNEDGEATWYTIQDKLDENGNKIPYKYKHDENGKIVTDAAGNPVVEIYEQEEVPTTNYTDAYNKNRREVGNVMPKGYGGFGFDLQLYGFDISTSFAYQFGGRIIDYGYQTLMGNIRSDYVGANFHKDLLKAWTPENKNTNIPRLQTEYSSNPYSTSTNSLISSNYLSLNNITVGYTIPQRVLNKLHLGSVRVYFAAENVALWSKRKGLDPRQGYVSSDNNTYSPIRSLSGGLTVSF